ncbi:MAG: YczE/YyaS/YitT family protein [Nocardioidaceae bacterium]
MLRPARRHLSRRLVQLYVGLVVFGWSEALLVEARLGVLPWDVLHQGLARHVGLSIGIWSVIVAFVVLLLWIPLRERPGLGTLTNALVIGPCIDLSLALMPTPHAWWLRATYVVVAIVVNAIATALYIGARFGPGPRDGLMTGFVRRTGGSVRVVRTCIEVAVVLTGFLLGGTLGVATLLFVFSIGPLVHWFLPLLRVPERRHQA